FPIPAIPNHPPDPQFKYPHYRQAGFTLLELVVVLAILALVAAVALPHFLVGKEDADLRAAESEVRAALRTARTTAVVENREVRFAVDPTAPAYGIEGDAMRPFAAGRDIAVRIVGGVTATAIAFFPSGGSSGGSIVLSNRHGRRELPIDGTTGQVADVP
ncbi:MAG TPA: GspH/FimT family pseudopilin, partial [Stellaceae bacterium]